MMSVVGSGYKLVHYLGQYDTTDFEVPKTLEFLRGIYPERKWISAPFSDRSHPAADLVISSDVIEHVVDPDELMDFLVSLTRKWLVISTPDRRRSYSRFPRSSWARQLAGITSANGLLASSLVLSANSSTLNSMCTQTKNTRRK